MYFSSFPFVISIAQLCSLNFFVFLYFFVALFCFRPLFGYISNILLGRSRRLVLYFCICCTCSCCCCYSWIVGRHISYCYCCCFSFLCIPNWSFALLRSALSSANTGAARSRIATLTRSPTLSVLISLVHSLSCHCAQLPPQSN